MHIPQIIFRSIVTFPFGVALLFHALDDCEQQEFGSTDNDIIIEIST
jgi:hypothetical protein